MGSTVYRLSRLLVTMGRSAIGICGLGFGLLHLRRNGHRAVVGGTTRVASTKLVAENLTVEARDVNSFFSPAMRELTELRLFKATVHFSLMHAIATQTNLRFLELKEVEVCGEDNGEVDLSFLTYLKNLETLIIDDCHELTSSDLHVLLEMPNLKRLVLGIEALTQLSDEFCASCFIDLSLILYGPRCLNDHLKLEAIPNLTHVEFVDFWKLDYPFWIKNLTRLEGLSFVDGTLKEGQADDDIILPSSLRYLSCLSSHMDPRILAGMLHSGDRLKSLEIDLPHFSQDIAISHCTDLEMLRISAKEFDGEILQHISTNKNLCIVELAGCQHLRQEHLAALNSLRHLAKISISCSCIGQGGCRQLAELNGIRCLEFHCCVGINLSDLQNATGLRSLVLDRCMFLTGDLNEFLSSRLVQGLDAFHIETLQPLKQ